MKRIAVAAAILTLIVGPLQYASGQQQPKPKVTESDPKARATPAGDFAMGRVEAVRPGNPTVLVLRVVETTDSVRRIKIEGRLTVELSRAVLRSIEGGAAGLRVGALVKVDGVVRDGRLIVTSAAVLSGK